MRKRYANLPYRGPAGELTPTEKEASSWLLDAPRLLDWPHKIHWLWPYVDQRKYVARLWGVDPSGTLIIVEIRKDRGGAPAPFEGFVFEIKSGWMERDWTAEVLHQNWLKSRSWESMPNANPSSIHRALKRRDSVGNPHPVLIGVIASTRPDFRLSAKARKNFEHLQKLVGDERVRLSVISGTFSARGLRVKCTTFEEKDWAPPLRTAAANARPDPRRSRRIPYSGRSHGWRYVPRFVVQG